MGHSRWCSAPSRRTHGSHLDAFRFRDRRARREFVKRDGRPVEYMAHEIPLQLVEGDVEFLLPRPVACHFCRFWTLSCDQARVPRRAVFEPALDVEPVPKPLACFRLRDVIDKLFCPLFDRPVHLVRASVTGRKLQSRGCVRSHLENLRGSVWGPAPFRGQKTTCGSVFAGQSAGRQQPGFGRGSRKLL